MVLKLNKRFKNPFLGGKTYRHKAETWAVFQRDSSDRAAMLKTHVDLTVYKALNITVKH